MKIVITGGHHTSALPVIKLLRAQIPGIEIYWFGHKHTIQNDINESLEYKEIVSLGIPFFELKAGKFYKTYNLKRLGRIPLGFFQAIYLLHKLKPDVIMSFGGYLAVPVVIAAYILRIPSLTHEQTLVSGYANKLIAYFASKTIISWPQSRKYFPEEKVVYGGIPLRPEIFTVASESFTTANTLPTIYITAGKTGSHKINLVVCEALDVLLSRCNIIMQCGDSHPYDDYAKILSKYQGIKEHQPMIPGVLFLRKFIFANEVGEAFNRASLVVTRAGAHITAELLALQKPALFIPIPWVSHNEQNINATFVKHQGLGEILPEEQLDPRSLLSTLDGMLARLATYKLVAPLDIASNSAQVICDEIKKVTSC